MSAAPIRGGHARAIAPAKVNLRLEVRGKRPDGFHDIATLMLALDLHDTIDARANDRGEVRLVVRGPQRSPDIPSDATNLAARAATAAIEEGRRLGRLADRAGVDLVLEKAIPSQSGLGGASSDAVAAWMATESALGFQVAHGPSVDALGSLGSDCVFFYAARSGLGLCTGRGERVEQAAIPDALPRHVAIVTPAVGCSTSRVYAAWSESARGTGSPGRPVPPNDLERAALAAFPELVAWRELLDVNGFERFAMSGSGSSFFGLFPDPETARSAVEAIARAAERQGLPHRFQCATSALGSGARLVPLG